MIISCPDCSTRYEVGDDAIGPNGRTVRCSNCSATWFVSHDADALALADNFGDGMTTVEAATRAAMEEDVPPPPPQPAFESRFDLEPDPQAEPVIGAHVQIRDRADQAKRNRRLMSVSMIWIVTLGILGAAAMLGYLLRQDLVDRHPPAASIFKALNIPMKIDGLDFENPATRNIIIDGRPVLVVNGVIINRSSEMQDLAPVELSLKSNSGETITSWIVELEQSTLGPQQRLAYMSQYPNPPVDAVSLHYRFVDDDAELNAPVQ